MTEEQRGLHSFLQMDGRSVAPISSRGRKVGPFEGDMGENVTDGQGRSWGRADSQDAKLLLQQRFRGCGESTVSWSLTREAGWSLQQDTQSDILGRVAEALICSSDVQVRTSVTQGF